MAQLIIENGPDKGASARLSRDGQCSVGSDAGCDLRLSGPGIATRHLVVKALRQDGYGVKCLDSVFSLNGRNTEAARLTDGDILEIGGTRIRFSDSSEARPPAGASKTLGGFALLEEIGSGGMGTVYRAEQQSLHREVALKVLSTELTVDPVFVARFMAEARAAARLHHPNVVQVFDVGHDGDTFYYSMELMHEGSLEARLKKRGKLDPHEALGVVADAARGLSFAESLQLVHRDIKPDNLMLDRHGHVKIADLGLAMTDEDDVSNVIGTPHFMSPEQALKKPLDHRSDLYSLGCTLYRLLTGGTPFKRASVKEILRAHVKDTPDPITQNHPDVPAEVAAIAERLLRKDPAERYQSAQELLADIEAVLAPATSRALWIGGIAVAVLAAGGGLIYGLTRPESTSTTKVIREVEKDPRVAKLKDDLREKDAEVARLNVLLRGLDGEAKAAALDAMASQHTETKAATAARTAASDIRAAIARAAAERAEFESALRSAVADLQRVARAAIVAGDYARASELVAGRDVAVEMRTEPMMKTALSALEDELHRHAANRLAELQGAFDRGKTGRDLDAVRAALLGVQTVLHPDTGWPEAALADPAAVTTWVAEAARFVEELENSLAAEAVDSAWQTYERAWLARTGILAQVHGFDLGGAAANAKTSCQGLEGLAPHATATQLAASLERGAAFLDRFRAAVARGEVLYTRPGQSPGEARTVTAFEVSGSNAGLTVKTGPALRTRGELIALGELRGRELARVFTIPGESARDPDRGAFLGWMAMAGHLGHARKYLADFDPQDPDSGTGEQGYVGRLHVLAIAAQALDSAATPWAPGLQREFEATQLLVRALRALSKRYNLSAANHLDQLRKVYPRTLVVRGLQ